MNLLSNVQAKKRIYTKIQCADTEIKAKWATDTYVRGSCQAKFVDGLKMEDGLKDYRILIANDMRLIENYTMEA